MIPIKFRGKRNDKCGKGKWVYGYYVENNSTSLFHILGIYDLTPWEVDPATVGQFTGHENWYACEIITDGFDKLVVIFHNFAWRCYKDALGQKYVFDLTEAIARNYKSCGNIHDNPELLK